MSITQNRVFKMSVVITNFNRKNELVNTIETALKQNFSNFEVIVVDNNSADGSAQMVSKRFPEVNLLTEKVNLGAVARNKGFEAATGKYIVSLDNDVYFRTKNELAKLYRIFEDRPNVACVNFAIFAPPGDDPDLTNWCHPRDPNEYFNTTFETDYISEGASAFRKSALDRVGLFYYPYFIGHEGDEMAAKFLDAGYNILYSSQVEVYHALSQNVRPSWRWYYYWTRNVIWYNYRNFHSSYAFSNIALYLVAYFFFSLRDRQMRTYFRAVRDGFKELPAMKLQRRPVSRRTVRRIKELRRLKPSLYSRIKKHLQSNLAT